MARLCLIGRIFGRLTVIGDAGSTDDKIHQSLWRCLCECGNVCIVRGASLVQKNTQSCGCLSIYLSRLRNLKHGMTKTRTYKVWCDMRERCRNASRDDWKNYGGRGIQVCTQWNESFEAFFADMGECLPGTQLDRIDNEGNYEPGNCRWATREVQANNRRTNRLLTVAGRTQTLTEWGHEIGVAPDTIAMRIKRGWDIERAVLSHKSVKWSRWPLSGLRKKHVRQ